MIKNIPKAEALDLCALVDYQTGQVNSRTLAQNKYLQRYESQGRVGLGERSRRPKSSPSATAEEVEKLILKERRKHPTWGGRRRSMTCYCRCTASKRGACADQH